MEPNYNSLHDQKTDLGFKSSQMHAQRLKKLKQKTAHMSHYDRSGDQSFANTKFTISRSTYNNLNPFDQTMRRESNQAPNKSNYFQSMNLKNIQSENKILYKKIQRIVKRKSKNLIVQQRNIQRKSSTAFQEYSERKNDELVNVTSDLAEDMIKNRATRAMIKQQEIRNQNIKMLQRLMSLKPTIETKKILNQTRRQKQISKRMSKFNSFHSFQEERDEHLKDDQGDSLNFGLRRHSLDNPPKKIQNEYEIPPNFLKRQNISNSYGKTFCMLPQSPNIYQRTMTQPVQNLDNFKLPTLSPKCSASFHSLQAIQQTQTQNQLKKRSKSHIVNYVKTSKNFSNQRFDVQNRQKKSNSTSNVLESNSQNKNELFKAQKALQKQKILFENQKTQKSSKKFILLGQIEKKIQKLNLRFRFVRFSSYYEIQIGQKTQKNSDIKNTQNLKGSNENLNTGKQKQTSKKNSAYVETRQMKPQQQKLSKSRSNKQTPKYSGVVISLDEEMGSALFSSFDYDYHRIVQNCLSFNFGREGRLNIELKEEFRGCERRMMGYHHSSAIRQNDQAEEEDSMDSVRQYQK